MRSVSLAEHLIITVLLLLIPSVGHTQDVLTIGGPTCITGSPGTTVHVPVYVSDVSGTALGVDRPAGSKIQAVSFRVAPSPTGAIATDLSGNLAIVVTPAGITSALGIPVFQIAPRTPSTFGFLAIFNESSQQLPFVQSATPPGNLVADVAITLSPSATPGTVITLAADPNGAVTLLGNQGGTASETTANGLSAVSGCITVVAVTSVPSVPMLGGWALIGLALLISAAAAYVLRR